MLVNKAKGVRTQGFLLARDQMLNHPLLVDYASNIKIDHAQQSLQSGTSLLLDLQGNFFALSNLLLPQQKPLTPQDLVLQWQQRAKSHKGKQEPLAKAFSLGKPKKPSQIVDTTAGLGRDSLTLALSGANVVMIERELPLICLLQQALQLAQGQSWFLDIHHRLELFAGDAQHYLTSHDNSDSTIAWYCDPMFHHNSSKSAQNKKAIQALQYLCKKEPINDLPNILLHQLTPGQKLVVKRPLHEPGLDLLLNFQIKTKTCRFDVHYNSAFI